MGGFGETILVFNAGSSSLKLGHFDVAAEQQLAHVETLWLASTEPAADRYRETVRRLLTGIDIAPVVAVGHRVVHGGTDRRGRQARHRRARQAGTAPQPGGARGDRCR